MITIFFFFHAPATTDIYTLSLHDALPISINASLYEKLNHNFMRDIAPVAGINRFPRSEEHTSELQSLTNLVCRLLLEKKKNKSAQSAREHSADTAARGYHY